MSSGDQMPCFHTPPSPTPLQSLQPCLCKEGMWQGLKSSSGPAFWSTSKSHPFLPHNSQHLNILLHLHIQASCVTQWLLITTLPFQRWSDNRPDERWLSNSRKQVPRDRSVAKCKGIPCQIQINPDFVISWFRLKKRNWSYALPKPTLA